MMNTGDKYSDEYEPPEDDDKEDHVMCRRCNGTGLAWEGWDCEWCCGNGYLDI